MRIEEMFLTAAEASCRLNDDKGAQLMLNSLMQKRDEDYTCKKTGTALGKLTSDETGSLLEEIIIQRRIELWGEFGRIYERNGEWKFEAVGNGQREGLNKYVEIYQ